MKPILVLGNGESRLQVDLSKLPETKIGCNAIHRDYLVDFLVAVDRRCVAEGLTSQIPIYTRTEWVNQFNSTQVIPLPELPYTGSSRADDPIHWGSGPYAVLLAATFGDKIKLLGFDLWGCGDYINNVYKGTQNYNKSDYRAVDPSYWIHQISKIFECFPDKYFLIYNRPEWNMPNSWKRTNVEFKTLDSIYELI